MYVSMNECMCLYKYVYVCVHQDFFIYFCLSHGQGINKTYESNTSSCNTKFKDRIKNQTKQLALKPVNFMKIRANLN